MALMIVVLPVPGPPVSTMILALAAQRMASICSGARCSGVFSTTPAMSLSGFGRCADLGERRMRAR